MLFKYSLLVISTLSVLTSTHHVYQLEVMILMLFLVIVLRALIILYLLGKNIRFCIDNLTVIKYCYQLLYNNCNLIDIVVLLEINVLLMKLL